MKYTQEPWEAGRNGLGELAIFTKSGKHTLSSEGDKPLPLSEREGNAQLQAAANDMYEALKLLATVRGMVSFGDGWAHLPDGTTICLNDLVAKAEGEPCDCDPGDVGDVPQFCDDCKREVDEIYRTRRDGVKQCVDCVKGEEGPQE